MCREESMQQAHGYSFEKLAYKFGPWLTFGNLGVFLWGWRGHVPRTVRVAHYMPKLFVEKEFMLHI